jgi:WD40 repeat protein
MNESGSCKQSPSRLVSLFEAAVELGSPEERVRFLEQECPEPSMRRELEALLAAHDAPDILFGQKTVHIKESPVETVGVTIGRYKLLQQIGEGGFGVVYMAEQEEPVRRRVALKIIKLGMDTKQVVARFEAERQALALMDHPNIARVFDGGSTETGRPYFVMELVQGVPITEFCNKNKLPARERLKLFVLVCQAIQSAHQKGIIHRDIKPSNVLVTLHHGEPMPKVIDFGIAKATNQKLTEKTLFTQHAAMIGTPAYMSPEQAEMSSMDIDTRTDVYALGVLLYELLTGTTPFPEKRLRSLGYGEMQRVIMEEEPERPSTRLNTMANEQKTAVVRRHSEEIATLRKLLKGDLDWIVMKCLEKDRTRRYETANGLAADLKRHLDNEPVVARPPSAAYRLQKAWRRNKLVLSAVGAVAGALLLGVVVSTWQAIRATEASGLARKATAGEKEQRQRAEQNADELVKSLYAADMRTAWQALQDDNLLLARESVYKYFPALGIPVSGETGSSPAQFPIDLHAGAVTRDLLGWEWRRLWALCQSDETFTLHGDGLEIRCAVFSPDNRLVATARGQTVYLTDTHSNKRVATLGGFSDFIDNGAVAFSNDGRYLAAKGGTNVLIWEVGRWQSPYRRLQGAPYKYHCNAVLFSPDGARFLTRVQGGLGVWDTATWQAEIMPAPPHLGIVLNYAGNGEWLAVSERDDVKILNGRSLEEVRILPRPKAGNFRVLAIDSCPKRGLLAAGYRDGEVRLWEVESWRAVGSFQAHPSFTFGLAFSPDGNVLATGGSDQVIKFWDVTSLTNRLSAAAQSPEPIERLRGHPATELPGRMPSGDGPQPFKRLRGHHAGIHDLSFAPDGQSAVSASKDGTAKFWNPFRAEESDILPNSKRPAWFSSDGARMITLNHDGRLHRWDTHKREDTGMIGPNLYDDRVKAWAISDDGERLALGRRDGEIEVWNLRIGQLHESFPHASTRIAHLAFARDSILLAAASERPAAADGAADHATLRIWDTASGAIVGTYTNAFGPLAFSSDRLRLVSTRLDGGVVVWDLGSGRSVAEIEENFTWIGDLALSPDDRLLISGSEEPLVNICDLISGKRIDSLKGSRMCIDRAAFTPDARTIATRTVDNAMKFWHVATGKEIFTFGPLDPVHSFLFSPNGEFLAITRDSETRGEWRVDLWRAPSFEEIITAEKGKARGK